MTIFDQSISTGAVADVCIDALVTAKGGQRIAVCIPARNEATTIASVVEQIAHLRDAGLVDEFVVVDDGSADATSAEASAGAAVVANRYGAGKGQAVRAGLAATDGDIVVLLEAGATDLAARVVELVAPLLRESTLQLVKATYRRPVHRESDDENLVDEVLGRALFRCFFPALVDIGQPLAGECAFRRRALQDCVLADGDGVDVGLLIDVYRHHGRGAIAEVDLGERALRNRALSQLRPHAADVLAAAIARVDRPHPTGQNP